MDGRRPSALVDGLSVCKIWLLLSFFFGGFIAFIIIGGLGPGTVVRNAHGTDSEPIVCTPDSCSQRWNAVLRDMNPMYQMLYLEVAIAADQEWLTTQEFPLFLTVDAVATDKNGVDHVLADGVDHTRDVTCHRGRKRCSPVIVFSQSHVSYETYNVSVSFVYPKEARGETGQDDAVNLVFVTGSMDPKYTEFEAGWKYFLVTVSLVVFLVVACSLRRQPRRSYEQTMSLVLLASLVFFNDPFFLAAVYTPGIGWSALYVFVLATFLSITLGFIGTELHLVAKAISMGVSHVGKVPTDLWFWLPKIVWGTLFWLTSVCAGMYALYRLDSDPAFSLWDRDPMGDFLFGFTVFLLIVFSIYTFVLLMMCLRKRRSIRRQYGFMIALTVLTVVCLTALQYAQGFSQVPMLPVRFLGAYGIANMFVITLAISQLPGSTRFAFDTQMEAEPSQLAMEDGDAGAFDQELELGATAPPDALEGRSSRGLRGAARAVATGVSDGFAVDDEDEEVGFEDDVVVGGPRSRGEEL